MTDQHRATPEQWAYMHERTEAGLEMTSCILELRARIEALEAAQLEQAESNRFCTDAIVRRVEALEAAQQDKLDRLIALDRDDPTPDAAMTELRAASAEARPAGGLVEQLAVLITSATTSRGAAEDVLRVVAAWLREGGDYEADAWADLLEREVFRG